MEVSLLNKPRLELKSSDNTISLSRRLKHLLPNFNPRSLGSNPKDEVLSNSMDGLAFTFYNAYNTHGIVELSPDQFLHHVSLQLMRYIVNRENLFRPTFSSHPEGKEEILVKEEELGDRLRWSREMWKEYTDKTLERTIEKNPSVGQTVLKVLTTKFSTTDDTQKLCRNFTTMAVVRNYYDYKFQLMCGINRVRFLGTLDDWKLLSDQLSSLRKALETCPTSTQQLKYEKPSHIVKDVLDPMLEVFQHFLQTMTESSPSEQTKDWWERIFLYERRGGSGPQELFNGWICKLYRVNDEGYVFYESSLEPSDFATILSEATMTVIYPQGLEEKLKFGTGFVGCSHRVEKVSASDTEMDVFSPVNSWWVGQWDENKKKAW